MSLRDAAREIVMPYPGQLELIHNGVECKAVPKKLLDTLLRELSLTVDSATEIQLARLQALEGAAKICDGGEEHYQDDFAKSVCIRLASLIRKLKEKK